MFGLLAPNAAAIRHIRATPVVVSSTPATARSARGTVTGEMLARLDAVASMGAETRRHHASLGETVRMRTAELDCSRSEVALLSGENRRLLRLIDTTQDDERAKISHDIHDDMLQTVIVAQMRLQMLSARNADPALSADFDKTRAAVGSAVAGLRGLMSELGPQDLTRGIAVVLREQLDAIATGVGAGFTADVTGSWSAEPAGIEQLMLFRIAREAIVNIRKHAAGCHVQVALSDTNAGWSLSVRDTGGGFVVADAECVAGHIGLGAMRKRAATLGGWCRITSTPGEGTVVDVWIPCPAAPHLPAAA